MTYFQTGIFNCLMMELLGPTLEDIFSFFHRKLSIKTTIQISLQMLSRIEFMHSRHFIHRDMIMRIKFTLLTSDYQSVSEIQKQVFISHIKTENS